jgi:serine/threonine protein phosphatase PrpC
MVIDTDTVEGSYRPETEDRLRVFTIGDGVVIAIADGMGGRAGGAAAADVFVRVAQAEVSRLGCADDPLAWDRVLTLADREIQADRAAGETTAVIVAATPRGISGASVGDSAAWVITDDHVWDLTAAQQHKPGLGVGMARPTPFRGKTVPGATLLVATDGLVKYADREAIARVVREPPFVGAARRLVELVRPPSGRLPDDVAVALCRIR